jgi:hypothetical protein
MKNKVELIMGDDYIPYYKIELYVRPDDLQDMRAYGRSAEIPELIGTIVLNELQQFSDEFMRDVNNQVLQKLKT